MAKNNKINLTKDPVKKTLISLTLPMMLGLIGMVVFNLADTFYVGQLGINELAAMSYTFPVVMVVGSLAMGLGIGVTAVVSRAIGEGNTQKVQRLTTDSILLAIILVGALVTVGVFTIDPLFRFLGAKEDTLPLINQFMTIWYAGIITVVLPMIGNSAIRATGDTKTPAKVMLVAVGVNLILDPIFIFGFGPIPQMGLAGAALATVISRSITLIVAFWVLYKREKLITLIKPKLKQIWSSWKEVMAIGLPATATSIIVPLSAGFITRLIATYGSSVVAAYGIASRLESFVLLAIMALSSSLSPFIGQNWGAKKYDRAKLSVKYSHKFSLLWGAGAAIILAFIGGFLGSLFDDNSDVISTVTAYFWVMPISYGLLGIFRQANTVFSVLKKPLIATLLTLIQTFALYIPLAYLGSEWFGIYGIFGAAAISFIITGIISLFWLRRTMVNSIDYDYSEQIIQAKAKEDTYESMGYLITHLHYQTKKYIQESFAKYRLDNPSYAFLLTLLRNDGLQFSELSEKLQVGEMAVDKALDHLLNEGYIIRQHINENEYGYFVTQKAKDISEKINKNLRMWSDTLSKDFSEEEKQIGLNLLKKMNSNAFEFFKH